jgi:release factor glutamine methyltransferase
VKTLAEVLQLASKFLQDRGIENPKRMAENLVGAHLKMKRMDLYLQFDKPIGDAELASLREPLKRCAKGEPIDYIIGEVEFSGCAISVDRNVLIPRPETEILVEKVKTGARGGVIWDLCTGSGCIGIALKKALDAQVVLVDCCPKALAVASKNAKANGVEIEILQGDFLKPLLGRKADLVVCNPPYIPSGEIGGLAPSVRDYEPILALDGGVAGLDFYRRLAADLPPFLNPKAQVFLEIGAGQGEAIKEIFQGGPWSKISLEKDWAGHDRFFFLEMQ